jgi:threonine dehydratase
VRAPEPAEVERAAEGLRGVLREPALLPFDARPGLLLAPELLQPSASFKVRGVHWALASLPPERRAAGVSTVSAGNTARALCWSARRFGIPARCVMPEGAPRAKVEAVRALGGTPVLVPREELFRWMRAHGWEQEPFAFVHPWIEPRLVAGHATLALELLALAPELEAVFVPVGGGGLLAGVGGLLARLRPEVRIVAVEPARCPSLGASLAAGRPTTVACDTICDGVAVPFVADELYALLAEVTDEVVHVEEDEVRHAMRRLRDEAGLVPEPSGALALAAALRAPARGASVAIVSGGNVDPAHFEELVAGGAAR